MVGVGTSSDICKNEPMLKIFFYLGFLLRPFTNQRTTGEAGGHFFNSSLPLPSASLALRH